ncbi:RING finger protein 225 [Electrophorus electricus]|uniref:RING-type domain-containing protein n=1 Tax=Electrophorus electricus TaxID=8005 RepID=A0A4W4F469_ELEEL|nr:RING finger protein 225 [Electrophorus electricus]
MEPQLKDPEDHGPPDEPLPDLECAVCFGQFNNIFNTPKILQCNHTFCLECLARINIISAQPESIQCPLCRASTPLPALGLPKLATDPTVLSCLPEPMQHVYSIRFSRDQGKLQVKRVPSSAPPCSRETRHSLDLGVPADGPQAERQSQTAFGLSLFLRLVKMPICRLLFMALGMLAVVSLTVGIVIILSQRK